ncbi:Uma2 family endonuclease [Dactylosporangium aurantiacum]|uniref:Uma2 family endonuclease n=1 Tax=Dactylosporangium aurantiacum TaxID=35754 RepID=A0A9Q9MDY2_9ACTN|nr:Uma2 family endonuclease [Dactylosporangium aurantiacum]MDG6104908.1 Uma2 family endonuclease [Dactylosporangium aurantiacum]UWZ55553.1 Uma2 family endonuclease [Dactylosporangium aurantiacum]
MTAVPDWMRPPRLEGWLADDLDHLPEAPRHTYFTPDTVLLVVEVVSPESAYRDRTVKLRKYAEAGIAHYWRVEEEQSLPVVHTYELDEPTRLYAPTGVHRGELRVSRPFAVTVDLDALLPVRR